MKIYVAPGHGITQSGTFDPGAVSGHEVEHTLARAVVNTYAPALRRCGFNVVEETEPDPDYIASVARANAAMVNCGDEIHFNAGGGHGTMVLVHPDTSWNNRSCATLMAQYISLATGLPNKGVVNRPDLYWLRATNFPATLPEIAFVDGDSAYIDKPGFASLVGEALARARCVYASVAYVPPVPHSQIPPWPFGPLDYLGTARPDPLCHSGYYSDADKTAVLTYQIQMYRRGWLRMPRTGLFDDLTRDLTILFQREKGIAVDGLVGPVTWGKAWTASIT